MKNCGDALSSGPADERGLRESERVLSDRAEDPRTRLRCQDDRRRALQDVVSVKVGRVKHQEKGRVRRQAKDTNAAG